MSAEEKNDLLQGLEKRRQKNQESIKDLDPEMIVHEDSGWTLKDLIGHITLWEVETVKSIEAFNEGSSYINQDAVNMPIDDFNQQGYESRKNHPIEQIMSEWTSTRDHLQTALEAVAEDRFGERMSPPWGGNTTITQLIKFTGIHEKSHINEIIQAARDKTEV